MSERYRADYRLLNVREHLGEKPEALDVPWAEFAGDESTTQTFRVPTDDVIDPYLELQVYGVDAYGHDVVINDQSLSGFDLPPCEGWQYWMVRVSVPALRQGENSLCVRRDPDTHDEFVVGTVTVNWREPLKDPAPDGED
ncbi:DUF7383 domain-containing protein [Halorientalis halophila]|uniref:DUF7383 domain-containing protein n=1 Tax=Halorientalis halophila TaxID=3108499 RepID=UPI00300883BC